LEHFDGEEALKAHQRLEVPCKLERNKKLDAITDAQEKVLRQRAKSGMSEEEKWREMYRVIFPGTAGGKVPSPFYDTDGGGGDGGNGKSGSGKNGGGGVQQKSKFQSAEDCKEYLRVELPRLVRPMITSFVNSLFEDFQERVNQKTIEIVRDVETRMLRTFSFQEEQREEVLGMGVTTPDSLVEGGHHDHQSQDAYHGAGVPTETSKMEQLFDDLRKDPTYVNMVGGLQWDVEDLMAESEDLFAVGGGVGGAGDSAYFTGSDGNSFASGIYGLL